MASSTVVFGATMLLLLLGGHMVDAHTVVTEREMTDTNGSSGSPLPQKINCGDACAARCRLSSRPRLCKRACGTCCARCNCVPPGTYGNREQCACYANMTTRGGKPKCP